MSYYIDDVLIGTQTVNVPLTNPIGPALLNGIQSSSFDESYRSGIIESYQSSSSSLILNDLETDWPAGRV